MMFKQRSKFYFMTLYWFKRSNKTGDYVSKCEQIHICSADQEILCFNGIKVHCRGFESSPLDQLTSQVNPVNDLNVFRRDTLQYCLRIST